MAPPRFARLVAASTPGAGCRLLDLEMLDEPLGFAGGQYVIVDSGLVLPNGKAAKRAYSILGADREQSRFQLAVKRIAGGLGSGFLHDAAVGATLKLSGPWGKLVPSAGAVGASLVLATDTGVTAALGLLQSAAFASLLPATTFLWLRTTADYFLPDELVRARLPEGLGSDAIEVLPPIDHPERVAWVRSRVRELLQPGRLGQAFLAGDGAVNYALLDDLRAAGVPATRDSVESFFNMPKKSGASETLAVT
jgi:ferredoxin-NADP reductase